MPHIFTKEMIIDINRKVNLEFGTTFGIRYDADIDAALRQPKKEYVAKAIASFHPFVDGNKRTALVILKFDSTIEKTIEDNHDILELLSYT